MLGPGQRRCFLCVNGEHKQFPLCGAWYNSPKPEHTSIGGRFFRFKAPDKSETPPKEVSGDKGAADVEAVRHEISALQVCVSGWCCSSGCAFRGRTQPIPDTRLMVNELIVRFWHLRMNGFEARAKPIDNLNTT